MFVTTGGDGVALSDPDNFTDLHVKLGASSVERAGEALAAAGCGDLVGEHAWLNVGWLREAGPDSDDWRSQFDAMIDYARGKGWTDDAGVQVRAHVVQD